MAQLALRPQERPGPARSLSPLTEMGAYEALWLQDGTTFHRLAQLFEAHEDALPSHFVESEVAVETAGKVLEALGRAGISRFGLRVHGAGEYPAKLRDAKNPVELLYFRGWWSLVESPCVAIVGTRKPSEDGLRRARFLAKKLSGDGWTIVSGLAAGIDTAVHQATLAAGGRTLAVTGTPLTAVYPRENQDLQEEIAENFLLVTQVPVLRYERGDWRENRTFFPERNVTMSALTEATIIVEASDTSGTLYQARAALQQGRKLFILESCFNRPGLTWPSRFEKMGAIRVRDIDDIRQSLGPPPTHPD